jgi:hypothetical protein
VKVLSIWCPWPQLIMLAGKDVENRGWSTTYRGPLAIHASKGNHSPRECAEILVDLMALGMITSDLAETVMRRIDSDRGKIIGVADIIGTSRESKSPWWVPGQVALELASPRLLVVPVAHRGEQGLREYVLPAAAQFEARSNPA